MGSRINNSSPGYLPEIIHLSACSSTSNHFVNECRPKWVLRHSAVAAGIGDCIKLNSVNAIARKACLCGFPQGFSSVAIRSLCA